jgi:hypothetical protein
MPDELPAEQEGYSIEEMVQRYFSQHGVVVKFVLLADVLTEEGARAFCWTGSDEAPVWDIRGLLDHGSELFRHATFEHEPEDGV